MHPSYLERTLEVRAALLQRPDLLEKIRAIFIGHLTMDGKQKLIGVGQKRCIYDVGSCEIEPGKVIHLLLKLKRDPTAMKFAPSIALSQHSEWSEFGAFETYYDFVTGRLKGLSFRSKAGFERFQDQSLYSDIAKRSFALHEEWGGTSVARGDIGAIPYFHMAVRYTERHGKSFFGLLTEGVPSLIPPRNTVRVQGTEDVKTAKDGRIINLSVNRNPLLIVLDRGGGFCNESVYPNNLGVRVRAKPYFFPKNRLDIFLPEEE